MRTAIVILNWNGASDTITCVRSLLPCLQEKDYFFIVDNGSTDDSVVQIERFLNDLTVPVWKGLTSEFNSQRLSDAKASLLLNGSNLGFGAGINRVLERLVPLSNDFENVWLLNNDAVVETDTLSRLKQALATDKLNAVAGSLILNYPDNGLIQCSGVMHYRFFGVSKLINKNQPVQILKGIKQIEFDYLNGASLLFKLQALKEVNFFDEQFFLYSEEFDLQLRLKDKGYKQVLAVDSKVYHKLSGGTGKNRFLFFYYYNTSAILLSRKHFGVLLTCCAALNLVPITALRALPSLKNFMWGLKGIWKGLTA